MCTTALQIGQKLFAKIFRPEKVSGLKPLVWNRDLNCAKLKFMGGRVPLGPSGANGASAKMIVISVCVDEKGLRKNFLSKNLN